MKDIYEEILGVKRAGRKAALVTIFSASGSTPREQGSKMLVHADGSIVGSVGGGKLEHLIIREALKTISTRKITKFHFDLNDKDSGELGMICGGETDVLVEPILPAKTLCIFGAGHIAIPLYQIGKLLDFNVVVIDDRQEFANTERFPDAGKVYAMDFKKVFNKLKIDNATYIVIATRGHMLDEVVLSWAVKTEAAYIGMIGSKTKVKTILSHLRDKGISQEQLARVHAPVGLEIDAETPEEIAVSVIAEIIKVYRST